MTDRVWDFESNGTNAVPPAPPAQPAALGSTQPVGHAPINTPLQQDVSSRSGAAPAGFPPTPPAAPGRLGQVSPAQGMQGFQAPGSPTPGLSPLGPPSAGVHQSPPTVAFTQVAPVAAAASLAPTRPPQPGERLLQEAAAPAAPPPRWGWRALMAFVAGGILTAGGFFVGFQSSDEAATDVTAAEGTPATSEGTAPIIVSPPEVSSTEPAAFVADVLGPSVVQVETPFGLGSGVVFRDGLILTNNHVIEGATEIRVRTSDGRTFDAELVGADARVDVAVLDVGTTPGLPIAELGNAAELEVGQLAIAIGSPFQLQQTVTSGIVSALNRPVPTGPSVFTAMIQTDTAINPGNSGGALADRNGRVIGINTAIQTDGVVQGNVGVGFAIPIDTAVRVADRIIAGEPLEAGFLGVGGDTVPGESGVVIGDVTPGSGAEGAGLLPGDRVIKIDGAPVTSLTELAGLVQSSFPGDVVELEVIRNGEVILINATLGTR